MKIQMIYDKGRAKCDVDCNGEVESKAKSRDLWLSHSGIGLAFLSTGMAGD